VVVYAGSGGVVPAAVVLPRGSVTVSTCPNPSRVYWVARSPVSLATMVLVRSPLPSYTWDVRASDGGWLRSVRARVPSAL
jgi:hypothetical protein